MRVYLAGPDVFFFESSNVADRKREACRRWGLDSLHPLDNPRSRSATAIYRANVAMLDAADCVVANLTPFRGVSADPGTAFEIGYAAARGLRVYGYSNDGRALADRAAQVGARREAGDLLAPDGMLVEDFGLGENLMITEAIVLCRGLLLMPPAGAVRPIDDLELFEDCLRLVAASALAPKTQPETVHARTL